MGESVIKLHNLLHDFPKLLKVYPSLYLAQIKMRIFSPGDPVGELLSEHCFAGKCSTSHVAVPGDVWDRGGRLGAPLVSQSCCRGVLRTSPGERHGLSFGVPRRTIISAPRLPPEVSRAPLAPSSPAASHKPKNSQI